MGKVLLLAGISLMVCALFPASGTTWYVDGLVSGSGNGKSPEAAFKTIQEGIEAATDGDTVIVAEGTYLENIHFNGKNIVLRSTDPLDPAVVANTIIDGNLSGSVVTFSGDEDESCVLSGFTICNGSADVGGGIRGGTFEDPCRATIRNNVITGNSAAGDPEEHDGVGGGLAYCDGTIQNNTISGNSAGMGGGLYGCDDIMESNAIMGNTADFGGGLYDCDSTIRNNLIIGNSAACGAGLYGCDGTIESNTISGNTGGALGGGLRLCRGTILNCIIWGNTAADDAQLSLCSEPTYSCIQGWEGLGEGNIAEDPQFVDADGPDDNLETYEDNDYHLAPDSPCTDTGRNEDWMAEAIDLDGNPRISYALSSPTVDIGAYEYSAARIIGVTSAPDGGVQLIWTSKAGYTYAIWSRVNLLTGQWNEQATVSSQGTTTSWTGAINQRRTKFYRVETK